MCADFRNNKVKSPGCERGKKRFRLGAQVLVKRLVPYFVKGEKQGFVVDWESYWEEGRTVEVGVVAVRKKNGRWKVVELELPGDVPEEDAEDILLRHWYVFDKDDKRRKCPPLYAVWGFDDPPVWVAACEKPTHEEQIPFAQRLKELEEGPDIAWEGINLVDALRQLGPGICTVVSDLTVFDFDILDSGIFAKRGFCPGCAGEAGKAADEEIRHRLAQILAGSRAAGVTVRTFTQDTVCVRNERSELVRVPVKEIRGFLVRNAGCREGRVVLECERLSPEAVRDAYCYDPATGRYIGLIVDERDHRFV
ncbi:hypothetical protein SAMN00808754_1424 [Thermanaeromonas toyohensis ToBE]|uniref:Uncharacterized protein n=1 Tax=Thermanaeromonas toyohensis ToBE TaxID=698762 RepID=A0A1W1VTJ0_9FIRM|nr:hypothetical protein [Thermanaeromonas toyohensis]SMB96204.1 hypothetical protein SAMN00808754_1424 [Thermanaeromonas toyohensis ToBE]